MWYRQAAVIVVLLLALLGVVRLHDTPVIAQPSTSSTSPEEKSFNHYIRLKIEQVTPVEKKKAVDLYELKVHRWYGKIQSDVLALQQTKETQEFNILFPAPAGMVVKEGDILDYQITRYLSGGEGEAAITEKPVQLDYTAWVQKCLKDFSQLKPGMKRSEIEKMFPQDGGLSTAGEVRFVHPECPCVKVAVEFSFQRDEKDQGRVVRSPEDPVITVSKPYLEYAIAD